MWKENRNEKFFVHTQYKYCIIYSCLENCLKVHLAINFNDKTTKKNCLAYQLADYETENV